MAKQPRLSTGLSGVAGEYFVAAELSRRGYIASIALRNTRGIDILASNEDATRSVGIQVKTSQGSAKSWLLNEKVERPVRGALAKNLCFVFVSLNEVGPPSYYVVSRQQVRKYCRAHHRTWLKTPGRRGQAHRDTPMRVFKDPKGRYLDKWESLGLG